jgi:thiamine kinase-like enzyme
VLVRWGGPEADLTESVERLGGLTNRTYKVVTAAGTFAVRLPGRGTSAFVDRDAERHNVGMASALGIGSEVLFADGGVQVARFLEGDVLSPATLRDDPPTLARVGRLLRRLHDSGRPFASRFDPVATIRRHRAVLNRVPAIVDGLIERVDHLDPPTRMVPCHNDPWPQNFIDSGDHLCLVDWEYSGMNDPAWDLADVCVEAGLGADQQEHLLRAYAGGGPDAEMRHRVHLLGPVTDLLWGLWALVQERDGNPADDFGTYGRHRLQRAAHSMV